MWWVLARLRKVFRFDDSWGGLGLVGHRFPWGGVLVMPTLGLCTVEIIVSGG